MYLKKKKNCYWLSQSSVWYLSIHSFCTFWFAFPFTSICCSHFLLLVAASTVFATSNSLIFATLFKIPRKVIALLVNFQWQSKALVYLDAMTSLCICSYEHLLWSTVVSKYGCLKTHNLRDKIPLFSHKLLWKMTPFMLKIITIFPFFSRWSYFSSNSPLLTSS